MSETKEIFIYGPDAADGAIAASRAYLYREWVAASGFTVSDNVSSAVAIVCGQCADELLGVLRAGNTLLIVDLADATMSEINQAIDFETTRSASIHYADVLITRSSDGAERLRQAGKTAYVIGAPGDVSFYQRSSEWSGRLAHYTDLTSSQHISELGIDALSLGLDGTEQEELALFPSYALQSQAFDAVLLPAPHEKRFFAKVAERAEALIALGVPFLASKSPELEALLSSYCLPSWLLLTARESWAERVAQLELEYSEVADGFFAAQESYAEERGTLGSARWWLTEVKRHLKRLHPKVKPYPNLDVVVLSDNEPQHGVNTLDNIHAYMQPASMTLVSALRVTEKKEREASFAATIEDTHEDFFEVFGSLQQSFARGKSSHVLFLKAGVILREEFFAALDKRLEKGNASVWKTASTPSVKFESFDPCVPSEVQVALFSRAALAAVGGVEQKYLSFALWRALYGIMVNDEAEFESRAEPVCFIDDGVATRNVVDSYHCFLGQRAPGLLSELRPATEEWRDLEHTLRDYISEGFRALGIEPFKEPKKPQANDENTNQETLAST